MSSEEITSLKEEIFLTIRKLEQKFFETLTVKTAQLSDEYEKYNEKLDYILSNNRKMIESIVSEKINIEKLNALESFKNKADGILISHEIRINNQNKDITDMKGKYDRVIEDNLIVPGYIGPKCQFNNVKEYIMSNNNDIARLKYEKEQLKTETKDFKSRFDGLFKQMISVIDNSVERSKEYTNGKIIETKKQFETKIDQFKERAEDLRMEIRQIKDEVESQVTELKKETEKINGFTEKTKKVEDNLNILNNSLMKVNYEINKLYEKNTNSEKKLVELKNDLARIKVMNDINSKSRIKQNYNNNISNFNSPIKKNLQSNEVMENNTMENIRNNNMEYIKDKTFSEKKNLNEKKKQFLDIKEKKFGFTFSNVNNTEERNKDIKIKNINKDIINKSNSLNNSNIKKIKNIINEDKKINIIKKQIINVNNINNDEEKRESVISEESFQENKEQSEIMKQNEFFKTTNNTNRTISRNEDIININPSYKESFNNNTDNQYGNNGNIMNNNQKDFTPIRKPELIKKRVSEIKFVFKTKSLKKVTYDITKENMLFPKLPNQNQFISVDNNNNIIIDNSPKDNYINNNMDNSAISESFKSNNEIKINDKPKERKQNKNDEEKALSRMNSIKSVKDIERTSNLPSYRSSHKNINGSNNISSNINKNKLGKNLELLDEDKYLLANIKKGRKKLNLSQNNNNKNNCATKTNSYYINSNNNINQLLSQGDFPQGINLVGLNNEKYRKNDSIYDDIYYESERKNNLKLERLGIPSPNSQKPRKKKIKLEGLSTEAPLKISAAFGRTAYTFIDKNNNKKIYSIQMIKKKPETEKLDIFFGSK